MVIKVAGEGRLVRDGRDKGPSLGARVESGDRIESGLASILEISLNGLVGLRLLPMTEVVVLRLDTEEPEIQLLRGNVIGFARKDRRSFKIETPDADMKIKSGQFWARYEKEKVPSAGFATLDGEAKIFPKNSSNIILLPKEAVDLTNGAVLQKRWATGSELQAILQAKDIEMP